MLGTLSIFMVINCSFVINPMLASLAEFYGEQGISYSQVLMLSTIVSLVNIPFSLISGAIAGKKVKFKTLAIISMIFALVGGIGPYFVRNYYAVLFFRALIGVAVGFSMPTSNALVARLFKGDQAATMQGIGTTVNNLAGVAYQFFGGLICDYNMHLAWFVHAILIIPLVLAILFLKEPEEEAANDTASAEVKSTGGMPISVILISLAWGVIFMVYYPMLLNMSTILIEEGIGTAAVAGTIQSLYTVGGMVAGVAFGVLYKNVGKVVLPIAIISQVAGLALGFWGTSTILLMIGSFLTGFAIFTIWPAAMMIFSSILPADKMSMASGIFSACLGVGGFLSAYYVGIIASVTGNTSPRFPIFVGMIITAIIGGIWSVAELGRKESKA